MPNDEYGIRWRVNLTSGKGSPYEGGDNSRHFSTDGELNLTLPPAKPAIPPSQTKQTKAGVSSKHSKLYVLGSSNQPPPPLGRQPGSLRTSVGPPFVASSSSSRSSPSPPADNMSDGQPHWKSIEERLKHDPLGPVMVDRFMNTRALPTAGKPTSGPPSVAGSAARSASPVANRYKGWPPQSTAQSVPNSPSGGSVRTGIMNKNSIPEQHIPAGRPGTSAPAKPAAPPTSAGKGKLANAAITVANKPSVAPPVQPKTGGKTKKPVLPPVGPQVPAQTTGTGDTARKKPRKLEIRSNRGAIASASKPSTNPQRE